MHGNKGKKKPYLSERNYVHGDAGKKLHRIWKAMKNRCNNSNYYKYHRYGGRGISYDLKWENYVEFKNQMYFKWVYAKKKFGENCLSIERVDVNGNYCFDNCIFIPIADQSINRVDKRLYKCKSPNGKILLIKNLKKFARENGLNSTHCYDCVKGSRKHHKNWKFSRLI